MTTTEETTILSSDTDSEQFQDTSQTNVTLLFVPFVSDELLRIFRIVNVAIIGQILAVFGMVSNIINLIVYYRLGFKETINISLFGLAMSDCMGCLTAVWHNICSTPSFRELDLPFSPAEVNFISAGYPHGTFVKITSCITAFITLERCLCVSFPLRVKTIITPKRVKIVIVFIYIVIVAAFCPFYYTGSLEWKFYPSLNKSLVGLVFVENRAEIEKALLPILGVFLPTFLFVSTVVCTAILVAKLKEKAKWKIMNAASSDSKQTSSRDTKAATMVVMISVVFIVCFLPNLANAFTMAADQRFAMNGKNRNTLSVFFTFAYILESINASFNIFIYYFRSSNYNGMLKQIFCKKETGTGTKSAK